jgi:hypothetical protein
MLARGFILAVVMLMTRFVSGDITVTNLGSGSSSTVVESPPGSNDWLVTLNATNAANFTQFYIRATDSNDRILTITTNNNVPQVMLVYAGSQESPNLSPFRIASINNIAPGPQSQGQVALVDVRVSGNVGNSTSWNITRMDVTGNVTGDITVVGNTILNLIVGGDLTGNVFANGGSDSTIRQIAVTGVIGNPATGSPSTIQTRSQIGRIEAASINATISATNSTGQIHEIQSTSGDISGSISCGDLKAGTVQGQSFQGFSETHGTSPRT